MRTRKKEIGNRNMVGMRVKQARKSKDMRQGELLAKIQIRGIDMCHSELSKLEGQHRSVRDFELVALADVLGVSVDWLLGREEKRDG